MRDLCNSYLKFYNIISKSPINFEHINQLIINDHVIKESTLHRFHSEFWPCNKLYSKARFNGNQHR